jgi:pimeloyl-ACP methyl ester carboxylesterase
MADDLHALLHVPGVPSPYVLVAHSFGPLISRLYASTYPDEVAGLVLIDGLHEDAEARFKEVVPLDLQERWIEDFWGDNPEGIALEESFTQVRNSGPLSTVPLIVIVHGDVHLDPYLYPSTWPVEVIDALDLIWTELVATQATLVPGGRLVVAEKSGHVIMEAQPALVIDAVRQVVEATRDPGRWATPQASPVA